jgi:hypothetical protein
VHEYRRDEVATQAAYASGYFLDPEKRSYISNAGHEFRFGALDIGHQRAALYLKVRARCKDCGRHLGWMQGDMDHEGKTTKTRCDCLDRLLADGVTRCTGISWRCTMDVRRGGRPDSCHAKKHGREIISDRKARRDAAGRSN